MAALQTNLPDSRVYSKYTEYMSFGKGVPLVSPVRVGSRPFRALIEVTFGNSTRQKPYSTYSLIPTPG